MRNRRHCGPTFLKIITLMASCIELVCEMAHLLHLFNYVHLSNIRRAEKHMKQIRCLSLISILFGLLFLLAAPAAATQAHGAPEGLFVHQLSHLFFIFAMGILIYWLRSRGLVRENGWRNIQYAALFFILWSLDAFFVHLLDEQLLLVQVTRIGPWQVQLDTSDGMTWLGGIYYLLKLDHLLCVPGLIFLYIGLHRLTPPETAVQGPGKGGA